MSFFSQPVLKVCLWDKAASEFCEKFNASEGTARVILVTTLNPKRFGGLCSKLLISVNMLDEVVIVSDYVRTRK